MLHYIITELNRSSQTKKKKKGERNLNSERSRSKWNKRIPESQSQPAQIEELVLTPKSNWKRSNIPSIIHPMAPPFNPCSLSFSLLNPLQNPNPLLSGAHSLRRRGNNSRCSRKRSLSTTMSLKTKSSSRYAILGAGFAGLSVAWHLLKVAFLFLSFERIYAVLDCNCLIFFFCCFLNLM